MSSITSIIPSMNRSNNVEKKKKYLIITVSLISGYKSQILEILNQLIPNSVLHECTFKPSSSPAARLEKQLRSLLEQDQIDCVLLRKNNHMGSHRDIIKQAVDQINNNHGSFHIELVLIDLIGNMDVQGSRFMNGIFTRAMMRNEPETTEINPERFTPRKIAHIVRAFCSQYQSVPRMQQEWQFDLIVVLNYTEPNLFRFVRFIVDEISGQYPEIWSGQSKLIKDDDVILKLTEPEDLKIERLEKQIQKFGFLDMKQFVKEHGDEKGIPDWLQQRLDYGCTDNEEKKKVHILHYIGVQFNGVQDIFNEITAHCNSTGKCMQTTIFEFEQLINGTAEKLFDFDLWIITEPMLSTSIEKLLTRTATHESSGGSTVELIGLNFLPKSQNMNILDQYYKSILRYQLRSMNTKSVSNGYHVVSVLHSRIRQLPSLLTGSNIESYFTPYDDQTDGSFAYSDTLRKILNYLTHSYAIKPANDGNGVGL